MVRPNLGGQLVLGLQELGSSISLEDLVLIFFEPSGLASALWKSLEI